MMFMPTPQDGRHSWPGSSYDPNLDVWKSRGPDPATFEKDWWALPHNQIMLFCKTASLEAVRARYETELWEEITLQHALCGAAEGGHVNVAQYLCSKGARMNESVEKHGMASRSIDLMTWMLEQGWDINKGRADDDRREHVLSVVIDDEAAVRWCLAHGARVPTNPTQGRPSHPPSDGPLLDRAARLSSVAVFKLLFGLGAPLGQPLHHAAVAHKSGDHSLIADEPLTNSYMGHHRASLRSPSDRTEMLKYLVYELAININHDPDLFRDAAPVLRFGTPMHYTASLSRLDGLRWLLENGADGNRQDFEGKTPLERAMGREDSTAVLREWMSLMQQQQQQPLQQEQQRFQ